MNRHITLLSNAHEASRDCQYRNLLTACDERDSIMIPSEARAPKPNFLMPGRGGSALRRQWSRRFLVPELAPSAPKSMQLCRAFVCDGDTYPHEI